jgi:membrane-associated protein
MKYLGTMIPFVDLVLNFDHYLPAIIQAYGLLTYVLLAGIIFLESAMVVFPFLPGDSLLFISGALSATRLLNLELLIFILVLAAVIGGLVNFWIGRYFGRKILDKKIGFFRQEYIDKTHMFFEKYGGFTIVIARFVPFVRSFAPFFAGLGQMNFYHFFLYNLIGAVLWIMSFTLAGYFFGNLPIVQDNFSLVILLIIGISLIGVLSVIINMFRSFKITDIFRRGKKD